MIVYFQGPFIHTLVNLMPYAFENSIVFYSPEWFETFIIATRLLYEIVFLFLGIQSFMHPLNVLFFPFPSVRLYLTYQFIINISILLRKRSFVMFTTVSVFFIQFCY